METPVVHVTIEEGVPRTINKRVKVKMIAEKHLDGGMSVEDIAGHYGIEIADVFAALAYYWDNKNFFDAQSRENEAAIQQHAIPADEHLADMRARLNNSREEG